MLERWRPIHAFVILFHLVLASSGCGNQDKLGADRTQNLQAVFEAIQHGSNTKLASLIRGLSEEEASKIVKKISEHWGDPAKLVKAGSDPGDKLGKGIMKTIVHWGSESTQPGKWFNLKSPGSKGSVMRIDLLFPKGSSDPRQLLAVEWDESGMAPNEESHGGKQ